MQAMSRRTLIGLLAAAPLAAACGSGGSSTSPAPTVAATAKLQPDKPVNVDILMNWFPEPEHGGFFLAENEGLYKAKNVIASVKPGGPGVDTIKLVAAGQMKFAISSADSVALARNEGVPVVALMAPFQKNPQIIMVHEESGIKDFKDIAEKNVRVAVATAAAYVPYLRKVYGWKEEQLLRYNGQLADWLNDKDRATQGYLTSEPFYARKAGAHPKPLLIADVAGYNPYANILIAAEETIKKEPELVYAVTGASIEGWRKYMESPEKTHAYIKTKAPDLTDEGMQYNYETMKTSLVPVGDAKEQGIGVMTQARWEELYRQLKDVGLIKPDLKSADAWTSTFFKPFLKK